MKEIAQLRNDLVHAADEYERAEILLKILDGNLLIEDFQDDIDELIRIGAKLNESRFTRYGLYHRRMN